jgi:hypothetical protein
LGEKGRVLIVRRGEDQTAEYNIALSCMLAAEKIGIEIDGLALGDCQLLQNAAEFTGGSYIKLANSSLLQTLLQVFLPVERTHLAKPVSETPTLKPS